MFKRLLELLKPSKLRQPALQQCNVSCSSIPKGWYVAEAGQDPLHMLWFVVLVNFDDVANKVSNPKHYVASECDSFQEALQECIKNCN